jgi:uncharacterized repeat protein (TIGR01451 family)
MKLFTRFALSAVVLACVMATSAHAGVLSADVSITKDDGATDATPGGQVVYTIVASNAGPNDATGSTVTDTFPASLTCAWTCAASAGSSCAASGSGDINDLADILAGGSVTYTATCDIDPAATGTLSNTATVSVDASLTDPNLANNSATDDDNLVPSADLSVTIDDGSATHTAGLPVTYTIVVQNNGPSYVTDAAVSDTFAAPLLNCSWTSTASGGATGHSNASGGSLADTLDMPVGSSVTYTVTCDTDPAATGSMSNTVTASSATVADPTAGNDSATDVTTMGLSADLAISKTDNLTTHPSDQPITYTIVVQNNGPSAVSDAVVNDSFPAPLENCSWTSSAAGGASGNTNGSGILNDTLAMPVGSSVTYSATCDIAPLATGNLSNTATVSSASAGDPNGANNSGTDGNTALSLQVVTVPAFSAWSLALMLGLFALLGLAFARRELL